jgi:hypothetical protein
MLFYKVKNGENTVLPWTETQYQEAILKVHQAIDEEKERLVTIFRDLCLNRNHPDLADIFELTLTKIQANYASQLSV